MTDKKKKKVIATGKKSASPNEKKKVIATGKKSTPAKEKKKLKPTQSRRKKSTKSTSSRELVFDRDNYKWMLIGLAVIFLGFFLMAGGAMPSPDVWDESLIYSHRRITLAPIVLLIGLGIEVYAIFK